MTPPLLFRPRLSLTHPCPEQIVDFGAIEQFKVTSGPIGAECIMSAFIAALAQIYFMIQISHGKLDCPSLRMSF